MPTTSCETNHTQRHLSAREVVELLRQETPPEDCVFMAATIGTVELAKLTPFKLVLTSGTEVEHTTEGWSVRQRMFNSLQADDPDPDGDSLQRALFTEVMA